MGRSATRLRIFPRAVSKRLSHGRRSAPQAVRRVLVAHRLLLGDTLMLSPLLARLRAAWPNALIDLVVNPAFACLYASRPWGVRAIGWDPADPQTLAPLLAGDGYDLALVPGDNRYSWLAQAAGARWIVAHEGDTPAWKNLPVDELRPFPTSAAAWGDMVADLIDGPPPPAYCQTQWPAPVAAPIDLPSGDCAVLHVGASTPLKQWLPARWHALAERLEAQGLQPVFLAGRGEAAIVREIDPAARWRNLAGTLDLAQVWHLLAAARLLVAPDTGISHLGRIVGVPTITLFGPGSAIICGAGEFWRESPFWPVTVAPFPCRDQRMLFRRSLPWVERCGRSSQECPHPRCMDAIGLDHLDATVARALAVPWPRAVA